MKLLIGKRFKDYYEPGDLVFGPTPCDDLDDWYHSDISEILECLESLPSLITRLPDLFEICIFPGDEIPYGAGPLAMDFPECLVSYAAVAFIDKIRPKGIRLVRVVTNNLQSEFYRDYSRVYYKHKIGKKLDIPVVFE